MDALRRTHASVFLSIIILLITIPPVQSAERGTIHGILIDSATGDPVVGAAVLVVNTRHGALTDSGGVFGISFIDTGHYEIRVSHPDYRTVHVPDLIVAPDSSVELSLRLVKESVESRSGDEKTQAIRNTVQRLVEGLNRPITNSNGEIFLVRYDARAGQVAYMVDSIIAEAVGVQPVTTVEELLEKVEGVRTNQYGEVFLRTDGRFDHELLPLDVLSDSDSVEAGLRGEIFNRGGRAFEVAYIVDAQPLCGPAGWDRTGKIWGVLLDVKSGRAIRRASVVVVGTNFRTVTDSKGKFTIQNVPDGTYEVQFSCKGYEATKVVGVTVGPRFTVKMHPRVGKKIGGGR